MRVLFVISNAHRTMGGAAMTGLLLLRNLRRDHGHDVSMVTPHSSLESRTCDGVEVAAYRDLDELKETVARLRPDVMLGSLEHATDAVRVANHYSVPCAVYLQSYAYCAPADQAAWGISPDAVFPSAEEAAFVIEAADSLFACSSYLAGAIERRHGREPEVLYPEFDPGQVLVDGRSDPHYITGVCGYRHKGLDVFLHLARTFPGEQFLLAGDPLGDIGLSYRRQLEELENLTLPGRTTTKEFLRRSKVVLVPSLWPEPFGRIAVEALANGIPLLASHNGGLAEILGDSPMGVRAFDRAEAWAEHLRELLASQERQAAFAAAGPPLARRFLNGDPTRILAAALEPLASKKTPDFERKKRIVLHGGRSGKSAYALINARWSRELAFGDTTPFALPDCTVHHDYEAHFTEVIPPDTGTRVAVRTWDFGRFPRAWVERINAEYDQLWVHSHWVAEQARTSGVDPQRVHVVPLGIDEEVFRPDGEAYSVPTQKGFKFLFVGGTTVRKGTDILLKAYVQAFSRQDDVCLVIKDHSGDVFYWDSTQRKNVSTLLEDPQAPEIVYIDDFLAEEELASLYRACDVSVFPYRAEGFCLPILEAMACGTPAIVPRFGACVDYCSEETSFFMPVQRINLPVHERFKLSLGFEEEIDEVDFCEVRVDTLVDFLRRATQEELAPRSAAGVSVAHGRFTWWQSAAAAGRLLEELADVRVPHRIGCRRSERARAQQKYEAAQQMYVALRNQANMVR